MFANVAEMMNKPMDLDAARNLNIWDFVAAIEHVANHAKK